MLSVSTLSQPSGRARDPRASGSTSRGVKSTVISFETLFWRLLKPKMELFSSLVSEKLLVFAELRLPIKPESFASGRQVGSAVPCLGAMFVLSCLS
jgi:hypothetical protein